MIKRFTQDYYGYKYFADEKGIRFRRDGKFEWWGYHNPTGECTGAKKIAEAWKTIFNPKTTLDVGCGQGTVIAYERDVGLEAYGFDWSEWAITEGRYARCKREWVKIHDATKSWPYPENSMDVVTAIDFFEHIYFDDLSFVVEELFRVAKKWIFLEIAVVDGFREKGYMLKDGERIPFEDGRTWAGHTTVQTEAFWFEQFEHEDWIPRRDLVNWFISLVPEGVISNWLQNSMIILEKM